MASRVDRGLFYACRFVSQGAQAWFFAGLFLVAGTGAASPTSLGGVFAAMLGAAVLLGLPAGALVDRAGPARGYLLGCALRLLAVAASVAVGERAAWVWLVAFAYSGGSQVFSASEMALVWVVQRTALNRGHLFLSGLQYAGQGAAVLLVAPLLLVGGTRLVLLAATIGYALLTGLALLLLARLGRRSLAHPVRVQRPFAFQETLHVFRQDRRAIYALGLLTFSDLAVRSLGIAAPRYLAQTLGLSRGQVIVVFVGAGIGVGLGLAWTLRRFAHGHARRAMRLVLAGMAGMAGALVLIDPLVRLLTGRGAGSGGAATGMSLLLASLAALVLGACICVAPVLARTVLSQVAPPGQQGRIFASQATLSHASLVLPLLLAGLGTQLAGPGPALAFLAASGLLLLVVLERSSRSQGPSSTSATGPQPPPSGNLVHG